MSVFRELHHGQTPLLLPNAWDYTSGAALAAAGFSAVVTTSLGVAAAAGKPDAAAATLQETRELARSLCRLPVPVTVDIENGFSDQPAAVAALVAELSSYEVAGVNIEDGQAGGTLAPVEHQVAVIEEVHAAAPEVFVNARTDTYWLAGAAGPSLAETLARCTAYARAGADGVFVPGAAEAHDIEQLVAALDIPLNLLYLPGRLGYRALAELGVARVSCGSLLYRVAIHRAVAAAESIVADTGDDQGLAAVMTYADIQRLTAEQPATPEP